MSDEAIPPKRLPSGPKGQHPTTLLVVPTKEERHNIDWVMERFQDLDDADLHVLVADDDSLDKTWSRAGTWAADDERIHLLRRPGRYKGRGFALRESYKWAAESENQYAYVLECSANRTDDILQVPKLIAALDAGADVVVGSRSVDVGGDDSSPRRSQGLARFARAPGCRTSSPASGASGWTRCARSPVASRRRTTASRSRCSRPPRRPA